MSCEFVLSIGPRAGVLKAIYMELAQRRIPDQHPKRRWQFVRLRHTNGPRFGLVEIPKASVKDERSVPSFCFALSIIGKTYHRDGKDDPVQIRRRQR